jgi:trimethylamine--corrinoid protein Co-methyltransferase
MARRSNARQAKIALRKAALAEDLKPVRAGESGGQYKPLSESDIEQIDATVYRILEEVGFADANEYCIETCLAVGATYGEDKRLRFPRSVVEDALNKCQRELTLYGQDPKHDLQLKGSRVHFSTAGAAVMIACMTWPASPTGASTSTCSSVPACCVTLPITRRWISTPPTTR